MNGLSGHPWDGVYSGVHITQTLVIVGSDDRPPLSHWRCSVFETVVSGGGSLNPTNSRTGTRIPLRDSDADLHVICCA